MPRSRGPWRQPTTPARRSRHEFSSLSLVRYRLNDYSVPTTYGHRDVLVRGYVDDVVISCGAEVIARHPRSYERHDFIFDPLHYLALIEQKINALDQRRHWPAGASRHHVHILEMNGDSYRLNQSKRRSRRNNPDTPKDDMTPT